jgi:hypothetical protein
MILRPLPVLAATLAFLAMPAPALASSADIAATRTYIQADYTLVHTARVNLATSEAALQKLRGQIGAECPNAAAGSPQNTDSEQLSNELVGAMTVAAIRPDVHAVARFVHTVQGLHWSNNALTHKVSSYAARLKTLSILPAPNICADVQSWAASRFQTLPASTIAFDSHYYKVEVAVGEVPAKLLAPSEQPDERPVLARAERLEGQLTEAEANAVYTWGHIMSKLGLNP